MARRTASVVAKNYEEAGDPMSIIPRWYTVKCIVCRESFQYRGSDKRKTCGRRQCVNRARYHWKGNDGRYTAGVEKPCDPKILAERGPAYHRCGQQLQFGTDGDGRTIEWCGCGHLAYVRALVCRD